MGLDDDLRAYYDAEAVAGVRSAMGLDPMRTELHLRYRELLAAEARRRLLDVGAGPGRDTLGFHAGGIDVAGVDLAPANVVAMRAAGLAALAGSMLALPIRDAAFDAAWTMSTFVHVPRERVADAVQELLRVVTPGAPVAIGTWGGPDLEGVLEFGELRPYRFFALSSHDRWRSMLERHGHLERFETFPPTTPSGWEYQFALLRRPR